MTPKHAIRAAAAITGTLVAAVVLTTFASAAAPKFFSDDPVWIERDTENAAGIKPLEVNLFVDLTYNFLVSKGPYGQTRAANVNTVDEVPDSSWYTSRIGRLPLTPADIANGPNTSAGPAAGAWTVTSSKSDGVTPGFTIKDSDGQRWFLKFDPPGYRGMSTGTEVAVTKLMWALGYNVPENHIAYMRREQLAIGTGARFTPVSGKTRAMRPSDLDDLFRRVDRESDGSYRIVASKALEGKPVGRIRFIGTRPDDPNDLVPHEDRRELRGYGVFAAWLNHVDAKAINSLDTLVTENGRSFVKHHLIDFGSSLGSGGVGPADYWAGTQYLVEPGSIGRQLGGFGFVKPAWRTEEFFESPSIGRLPRNNKSFDPEGWKPRVPNQAFLRAQADDKFWAARKLSQLTTEMLRAAVQTGDFNDPQSEAFLVNALAERRDAIIRAYLTGINPISDAAFDETGTLTFANAAVDADVAHVPRGYRAEWFTFDNLTGYGHALGITEARGTAIDAPANLPQAEGSFIRVALSAIGGEHKSWNVPVDAYFRMVDGQWQLVGFERIREQS